MSKNIWRATAPSNIALIKYMGKTDSTTNHPSNASVSYTLDHLQSYIELTLKDGREQIDSWRPLERANLSEFATSASSSFTVPELSAKSQQRFLTHLQFLKSHFNFSGHFQV